MQSRVAVFDIQSLKPGKKRERQAYQRQTLNEERPEAQEAPHDEARQYTLNLRNAGTGGVFCQGTDEVGSDEGECSLFLLLCRQN